jgi:hypothetical protein
VPPADGPLLPGPAGGPRQPPAPHCGPACAGDIGGACGIGGGGGAGGIGGGGGADGIGGAGGGRWLSVAEVGGLLGAMELPQYAAAFREASIDGSMVEDLPALWDDLGVGPAAHRLKIAKRLGWAVRAALEEPRPAAGGLGAAAGRAAGGPPIGAGC